MLFGGIFPKWSDLTISDQIGSRCHVVGIAAWQLTPREKAEVLSLKDVLGQRCQQCQGASSAMKNRQSAGLRSLANKHVAIMEDRPVHRVYIKLHRAGGSAHPSTMQGKT